ncbi:hypothetical protein [Ruminococcus difficilis]|uniref:Uncharacterized protein n=1 Tax=Ruminococcus difficilis TaxID=2763069 RepID=A0A934WQD2_9FIRM|nr:hypothetical protein [Ruminococcus difficilis]MBK6087533.1 hypothetical protein [Ruminococcus difficilis]
MSQWSEMVREREESGLSIREFCAGKAIRPFSNEELESFMPWSDELKESIASRTKPTPLT